MYESRVNGLVGYRLSSVIVSRALPLEKEGEGAFISFMCSSITERVSCITGEEVFKTSSLGFDVAVGKDARKAVCGIELDEAA